ncbi:fibronectin-binding domain-containing protein [Candidatus Woesearchaeota archaeon]|jgi:predicted ribosome quality control (RQC) complex YloA/Tae2 family protein|nr:fibronectin-binding domain-containing protein [Candidatus Woesearchaeota archaeon]MBT4114507.1 fibronectin-binding domain-containing protein [Candidatus Woesearchaeota archaeon]MBT4247998.1 fibronectin-binding domain-containing protein [Candidatus Woesearchaeota archaeon]
MVKVLTSLELSVVIRELQQLVGTKVSKIHQPNSRLLTLNMFKTGGSKFVLKIDSGVGMYVTSYASKNPLTPNGFCLFLRKHLHNSRLVGVVQKDLERIVELHFDTSKGLRILICELFSKGNFVLCDGGLKILNCASVQQWKDRTVRKGETYKYPPPGFNILAINKLSFQSYLNKYPHHEVVRLIATLGFGGIYAEEICLRADIQKNTVSQLIRPTEVDAIYTQIVKLLTQFKSNLTSEIIYEGGAPIEATPFPLSSFSEHEHKLAESFNQALDTLYTSEVATKVRSDSDERYQQEKNRLETIYNAQKQSCDNYIEEYNNSQRIADMIYSQYNTIYTIFSKIKAAVDAGHDWYEVYQVLQREKDAGIHEASLVKEIKPETRQITIDLGELLALDLTKSLEENAGDYYDLAKRAKAKLAGAQRTLDEVKQKLDALELRRADMQQEYAVTAPKFMDKKKQDWYEKFHWFFTSSGLLAIGGRDATSNEVIIKKHMDIKDVVFHTEIAGSPFFVLKEGREKATEQDLAEVAQATASYSSAWKLGVGSTDVYQVKPEQVSKQAQSGTYLGKGSFVISGKRNYFRNTVLEIAIGMYKDRMMGGATSAIKKYCETSVVVKQGDAKKSDIAKKVAHKFSVDVDTVLKLVPTGSSRIVE